MLNITTRIYSTNNIKYTSYEKNHNMMQDSDRTIQPQTQSVSSAD